MTLATNNSRRDKEEIDGLRKEITDLKTEMFNKEKYQRAQTDRISRQLNDMRAENQELKDEIAELNHQLRLARQENLDSQKRMSGIG